MIGIFQFILFDPLLIMAFQFHLIFMNIIEV